MKLLLLLVLIAAPAVLATSSGQFTSCDAEARFGCTSWVDGDRLNCEDAEEDRAPMHWAMAPERSTMYSLRSGDGEVADDPTSYTPGELMSVYLRVLHPDWKYRGLLLHAVDSGGSHVGEWPFPADERPLFWSPPQCPQAVFHTNAEEKPYGVRLRFLAPPAGTGTITFKALVKKGPANHGFFYYPNLEDLVLTEGPARTQNWFQGAAGETCEETCARYGGELAPSLASTAAGQQLFEETIGRHVTCKLPILEGCLAHDPSSSPDGKCYYYSDSCAPYRTSEGQDLTVAAPTGSRFCPCAASAATTGEFSTAAPTGSGGGTTGAATGTTGGSGSTSAAATGSGAASDEGTAGSVVAEEDGASGATVVGLDATMFYAIVGGAGLCCCICVVSAVFFAARSRGPKLSDPFNYNGALDNDDTVGMARY